jgi:hypothetical protein
MPLPIIAVTPGVGATVNTPASGRQLAADSQAVVLSTEDLASLVAIAAAQGSLTETAPATDTASAGLNGRMQRIAQRLTSLIALVPAALGSRSAATSFAVALSTEDAAALASLRAAVIVPLPDASTSVTLNAGVLNSSLVITPNGYFGGSFDIGAIAGGAIIVFEQLATDTSAVWDPINVLPLGAGDRLSSTGAAGRFEFIAGAFQVRARVGTVGTGTIAVRAQMTAGQKVFRIFNTSPVNLQAVALGDPRVSDGASLPAILTPIGVAFSVSATGNTALVAAVAGKKIRVLGLTLISTAANTIDVRDGSSTSLSGPMDFAALGGIVEPFTAAGLYADGTVNTPLNINLSAAVKVAGHLKYVLV